MEIGMIAKKFKGFMRPAVGSLMLAVPLLSLAAEPEKVVCLSIPKVPGACEGVAFTLNAEAFLKRWPSHVGVRVAVQQISPKFAHHPLTVEAGMLEVYLAVSDGKRSGMRPIYTITMSHDTDNLSDGAPPYDAAKFMGMSLARRLNELMESGAVDK
jgi:hypothetical protein